MNGIDLSSVTSVERRTLSSSHTFFMKWIFTSVWIAGMGAGFFAFLFSQTASTGDRINFAVLWVLGSVWVFWTCGTLKRVRLEDGRLLISNYLREISVPISSIRTVTENRLINIHPVTIHFKEANEFGNSAKFMPKMRIFGFFSSHPVVEELLTAAQRHGTTGA